MSRAGSARTPITWPPKRSVASNAVPSGCFTKVHGIGPKTHQWAEAMLHARGIEGTRMLLGVIGLTKRHSNDDLEKACETALSYGAFHLRTSASTGRPPDPAADDVAVPGESTRSSAP